MSQPDKPTRRKLHSRDVRSSDVDKLFNSLRALDRTVVEISMRIYRVPQRDRATMRKQHRRLHDTIRERLPRFLYQPLGR